MEEEVVIDTTVLSNFSLVGRLDILEELFLKRLLTTEEVLGEIKVGIERKILPEIDIECIKTVKIESELPIYIKLREKFGKGEASCLAIALNRGLKLLTDDIDARRFAQRHGIPVSGTVGVLAAAVEEGIITLEEGNKLLSEMIEKGYYSPVESLDEVLL
ncbi:MAG: DUF3368 domain-containing protein [Euryarchaeota archaeon]|nr:DUF3368 domain-containing protein [Euryarchaeota archaeon]